MAMAESLTPSHLSRSPRVDNKTREAELPELGILVESSVASVVGFVDQILPKKPENLAGKAINNAKNFFENKALTPNGSASAELDSLASYLRLVTTPVPSTWSDSESREKQKNTTPGKSVEVLIKTGELPRLYTVFTTLAIQAEVNPAEIFALLRQQSRLNGDSPGVLAMQWLSVLNALQLLHHPRFREFSALLRDHAAETECILSADTLKRDYWGGVIDDETFWQERFTPSQLSCPDRSMFTARTRSLRQEEERLDKLTIASTVKQVHALGNQAAVSEYRQKTALKQKIKRQKMDVVIHRVDEWRRTLRPITDSLALEDVPDLEEDCAYISQALMKIVGLFIRKKGSGEVISIDGDISQKAQKGLGGESLADDEAYSPHLYAFVRDAIMKRDPAIMWLMGWRNPTLRNQLWTTIFAQKESFLELSKLIVSELSRMGLLRQTGELDLLFRRSNPVEDQQAIEQIPQLLSGLHGLGAEAIPLGIHSTANIKPTGELGDHRNRQALEIARQDVVLDELLSETGLQYHQKRLCIEQARRWLPRKRAAMAEWLFRARLRSQRLFTNTIGDQVNKLRPKYLWKGLKYFLEGEQQKKTEFSSRYTQHVGVLLGTSTPVRELQDMPLIVEETFDGTGTHLLNIVNARIKAVPGAVYETLVRMYQDYSRGSQDIAFTIEGIRPLALQGFGLINGYCNARNMQDASESGQPAEFDVVYARQSKQVGLGMTESGLQSSKEYRLHRYLNIESAKKYNSELINCPALQKIHFDTLQRLLNVGMTGGGQTESQVILDGLQQLQDYLHRQRYYDISDNRPPEGTDALQWIATHPDVGFECTTTARVVEDFLNSFGIPCVRVRGRVPFYYRGQLFTNQASGHQITSAILPNREVVDLDFTPPATPATPPWVKDFLSIRPPKEMGEKTTPTNFEGTDRAKKKYRWEKGKIIAKNIVGLAVLAGLTALAVPAGEELFHKVDSLLLQNNPEFYKVMDQFTRDLYQLLQQLGISKPPMSEAEIVLNEVQNMPEKKVDLLKQVQLWWQQHHNEVAIILGTPLSLAIGTKGLRTMLNRKKDASEIETVESRSGASKPSDTKIAQSSEKPVERKRTPDERTELILASHRIKDLLPELARVLREISQANWEQLAPIVELIVLYQQGNQLQDDIFAEANITEEYAAKLYIRLGEFLLQGTQSSKLKDVVLGLRSEGHKNISTLRQHALKSQKMDSTVKMNSTIVSQIQRSVGILRRLTMIQDEMELYQDQRSLAALLATNQSSEPPDSALAQIGREMTNKFNEVDEIVTTLSEILQQLIGAKILATRKVRA